MISEDDYLCYESDWYGFYEGSSDFDEELNEEQLIHLWSEAEARMQNETQSNSCKIKWIGSNQEKNVTIKILGL